MSIGNMPPEPDFWVQTPIGVGFGDTPPKTDYGSLVVPIIALGAIGIAAFLVWRWMRSPKVQRANAAAGREAMRTVETIRRSGEAGSKHAATVAAVA